MKTDTIIFITHDENQPSFRYRIAPLMYTFESLGYHCKCISLSGKSYILRVLAIKKQLLEARAVILHKLKLPVVESILIHQFANFSIYDVDDAIYLKQPKWVGHDRKLSRSRQKKFDAIVKRASLTTVGNRVLENRARRAGANTFIAPTGIDLNNYWATPQTEKQGATLVWVGLPDNLRYLEMIKPALEVVCSRYPNFKLRIISSKFPSWSNLPIEKVTWDSKSEKTLISTADIGIMPLSSDPYSEGKCAFKLLQYMAASIPCIASPVGANTQAILHGKTGFLAATVDDWQKHICALIDSQALRESIGHQGRQHVELHYDIDKIARSVANKILLSTSTT